MALNFPTVDDFPGGVIPDGEEYEGFYWDAAAGVWKRLCERDKIGDCLDDDIDETVCDKLDVLQSEIVELEEEIEAIAITSERGEWISATSVNPGEFRMVNLFGQNTQSYEDETVVSIFFNNNDANDPSVEHGWADVEVGNILELLDKPDSDYAIYEITGKNPGTGSIGFDVAFVKGVGEATLGDRTRIKIFAKPTGGNLQDYVRIAGDTMTGELQFYHEQADNKVNYSIPAAGDGDLRFATKRLDTNAISTTVFYQPGYTGALVCSGSLMSRSSLYTTNYIYGTTFNSDGTKTTKNPRIYFDRTTDGSGNVTSEYGALRWSSSNRAIWNSSGGKLNYNDSPRLEWNSNRVDILKPTNNTTTADGFLVRGATTNNNNYTSNTIGSQAGSLLVVKHVSNQPDHIEYRGKITESTDIVNKAYVDNNVNGNVINGNWNGNSSSKITITKSSGVYYITGG